MTYIIHTSEPLKAINGTEIRDGEEIFTLGKAIAGALLNQKNAKNKMRNYFLAQSCYQNETVSLNKSDIELIREAALESDQSLVIIGALVSELDQQVADATEKVPVKKLKTIPGETV